MSDIKSYSVIDRLESYPVDSVIQPSKQQGPGLWILGSVLNNTCDTGVPKSIRFHFYPILTYNSSGFFFFVLFFYRTPAKAQAMNAFTRIQLESSLILWTQLKYIFSSFCFEGDLGGTFGLFLGMSCLTLFEFVDFTFRKFVHLAKGDRGKRAVNVEY